MSYLIGNTKHVRVEALGGAIYEERDQGIWLSNAATMTVDVGRY